MEFTLKSNGLENEFQSELNSDIDSLTSSVDGIKDSIDGIKDSIDKIDSSIEEQKSRTTALSAAVDNVLINVSETDKAISGFSTLVNTKKMTSVDASIQSAVISKADITELSTTNPIKSDIKNSSVTTGRLESGTIEASSISATSLTAEDITVGKLEIDNVKSTEVDTQSIISDNAAINNITINDEILFNGIALKSISIRATGIDNMHLHKIIVKANGQVLIKMPDSSIIISASSVTSNYDGLYASYIEDGNAVLYISRDIDCQALVIGEAKIHTSTVLKTSVRRNADSNGNPNIENTVKVAVVSKLPSIGQKNVIYVVLGDCSYYCDGQYFYEMASKKRG